jgi:hypothetical protein
MERPIAPSVEWIEVVCLKPSACECRAYCLEPSEVLLLTLAATDPIDAALVDWNDYQLWHANGGEGMPSGNHFANDTRSVRWRDQAISPPYIAVLVIMNPGRRESCVTVEAKVEMVRVRKPPTSSTTPEDQPSDTEVGCSCHQ